MTTSDLFSGSYLFCEITYLKDFVRQKPKRETIKLSAAIEPALLDGNKDLDLTIKSLKEAREKIWESWKDYSSRIADTDSEVSALFFEKNIYWTDHAFSHERVTGFIRTYICSIPGNHVYGVPSRF